MSKESKKERTKKLKAFFIGGLLPVILFTLIEDHYGTLWGLIAGMILGVGEILWEYFSQGKVDTVTWCGNGMLLALGGVSLVTQNGLWFKLQPALIEAILALVLWVSILMKKSLLLSLAQKQGSLPLDLQSGLKPGVGLLLKRAFQGLTFRIGLFFALHSILAVWAALFWTTAAWALLKGVGFTLSFIVYLVVETLVLRYRVASIP